jgi:hypothetical protein
MSDIVVIKSSETVRFPVTSEHPLAKHQQQFSISQLTNLNDLAIVRAKTRNIPGLSASQVETAVNGILASSNSSAILQLTFPDLTVEPGATMVCDGPITTISAGNVIVLGEILAYGSLNLSCTTLGSIAVPTISSIGPSSGSTLGGTEISIVGSGFEENIEIYFGSTPAARVVVDNDGLCSATAPPVANPGPVDVTVRAFGVFSSAATPADVFTYVYTPDIVGVTLSRYFLWTGESAVGTITLNEPASAAGMIVTLSVSGSAGVTVPGSVAVAAGAISATFSVTAPATAAAGAATIAATDPNGTTLGVDLEVYTGQIVVIVPGFELFPGDVAQGTILLRTPAPASGGVITLTVDAPKAVSIPATVPLPGGSTSATFAITALPVTGLFAGVTVTAHYAGNSSTSAGSFNVGPKPRIPPTPVPPPHRGGPNPA